MTKRHAVRFSTVAAAIVSVVFLAGPALAQSCHPEGSFEAWLKRFRQDAAAAGVSEDTIAAGLKGVRFEACGEMRCGEEVLRSEAGEFGIGPRALAGLVEAVAAAPHGYDAEADGEVRGLRLEVAALFDAMEDDPELAVDVLAALARSSALALGL